MMPTTELQLRIDLEERLELESFKVNLSRKELNEQLELMAQVNILRAVRDAKMASPVFLLNKA